MWLLLAVLLLAVVLVVVDRIAVKVVTGSAPSYTPSPTR